MLPKYTLCEVLTHVRCAHGSQEIQDSRSEINNLRRSGRRDCNDLRGIHADSLSVEIGPYFHAPDRPNAALRGPRMPRSRVGRLAHPEGPPGIAGRLGNHGKYDHGRTPPPSTNCGLSSATAQGRSDGGAAFDFRLPRVGVREDGLTTSRYIKSRDNLNALHHNISSQGGRP